MENFKGQILFRDLTFNEEERLTGGFDSSSSGTLAASPMMSIGSFTTQGETQGGGSSNGVTVDMNFSAVLISALVGRFFGLRGNALSWYMLMNSVRLRWL